MAATAHLAFPRLCFPRRVPRCGWWAAPSTVLAARGDGSIQLILIPRGLGLWALGSGLHQPPCFPQPRSGQDSVSCPCLLAARAGRGWVPVSMTSNAGSSVGLLAGRTGGRLILDKAQVDVVLSQPHLQPPPRPFPQPLGRAAPHQGHCEPREDPAPSACVPRAQLALSRCPALVETPSHLTKEPQWDLVTL